MMGTDRVLGRRAKHDAALEATTPQAAAIVVVGTPACANAPACNDIMAATHAELVTRTAGRRCQGGLPTAAVEDGTTARLTGTIFRAGSTKAWTYAKQQYAMGKRITISTDQRRGRNCTVNIFL